jgi:hypothetical protein
MGAQNLVALLRELNTLFVPTFSLGNQLRQDRMVVYCYRIVW